MFEQWNAGTNTATKRANELLCKPKPVTIKCVAWKCGKVVPVEDSYVIHRYKYETDTESRICKECWLKRIHKKRLKG